ncbi:MAG: riboflavin biosynthesis protein RibF [Chloroflexi bacterium]|nr:riboflavin biosynthesis protein RibF [Chloroflexota bacterium]
MGDTFTEIIEKLSKDISKNNTSLCIGTFDGVHSGHKKLFNKLIRVSKDNNSLAVVFVFKIRPREIINIKSSKPYILPFKNRANKIKDSNIEKIIEIDFDKKLQVLSSEEFLKILKEKINLRSLITSVNTRIGKDQINGNKLQTVCKNLNIDFHQIDMTSDNEKIISSSNISSLIDGGKIEEANSMLGENFYFSGRVIEGDRLGRTIGFPTANLFVKKNQQVPGDGIFVSTVEIENKQYPGALSIGIRPVIKNDDTRKIEVYILDFNKDIYGEEIKVNVIKKIRNQIKYNSLEDLKIQIKKDITEIKKILSNG